jgi:hypothetical protein
MNYYINNKENFFVFGVVREFKYMKIKKLEEELKNLVLKKQG